MMEEKVRHFKSAPFYFGFPVPILYSLALDDRRLETEVGKQTFEHLY
jgi:hypothetical protein